MRNSAQIKAASLKAAESVIQVVQSPSTLEGFIGEKQIFDEKLVPVSRRTWNSWKKRGIIPFIRIGRRCLYHWPTVVEALRRRQVGAPE